MGSFTMMSLRALLPLVAAPILAAPAAATPPLSAYGQLPAIRSLEISPDGSKFAAIVGDEQRSEIQVRAFGSNQLLSVSSADRFKVRSLQWAGPDHVVTTVSTTASVPDLTGPRREWFQLLDYSLKTRKWRPLLSNVSNADNVDVMNVVAGDPTSVTLGGKPFLIVPGLSFPHREGTSTLFKINLDSGHTTIDETGNTETLDWLIGPEGKALARADYTQARGEWRLFLRPSGSWRRVYDEIARIDRPYMAALGSGDTVVVGTRKSGELQMHEVNLTDGSWSPPRPDLDADGMVTDPATHRVIGTVDRGLDTLDYHFHEESDQKLWRGVVRAFPGEIVSLQSWTDDRTKIIVEVEGPTNGDAFFIVDRKAKTADWLADRYQGIGAKDVGPVRAFRYKAADGTEIPAYLTLPAAWRGGRPAKSLPLIVLVHGGPASRDTMGFDWWAQALASRGYAVLQPQFRGSDGFGPDHLAAGHGQWGRKMQSDVSDGVRFLAAEGTIDTSRVCIAGGSYGGYAALAGVTVETGVYRCAVSVAGVADLRQMLRTEANEAGGSRNSTLRYWRRFMGAASTDDPGLDAISPAKLAARARVPVMLIHGKDDTVVRYEQSQIMERALREAGGKVEFVTLGSEDHWLSRSATRIGMLNAMVGFIEKHNPPAVAVAAVVGR